MALDHEAERSIRRAHLARHRPAGIALGATAGPERDSLPLSRGAHTDEELEPDNGSDLDLVNLPRQTLIELLQDDRTAGYVRVLAAEALARLGPSDESAKEWTRSVQVRADYKPPSHLEIFEFAVQAAALTAEDVVAVFEKRGGLDRLRAALGSK